MRRIKLLKDEKSALAIEEAKRHQPQSEITDLLEYKYLVEYVNVTNLIVR